MPRSELRSPVFGLRDIESGGRTGLVTATSAAGVLGAVDADPSLRAELASNPARFVLQITGDAAGGARIALEPEECAALAGLGVAIEFAPRTAPPEEDIADLLGWD